MLSCMTTQETVRRVGVAELAHEFDAPPGYLAAASRGILPRRALAAMVADLERSARGLVAPADYDDVVATLEREGIEKFVASFDELLSGIAEKRRRMATAAEVGAEFRVALAARQEATSLRQRAVTENRPSAAKTRKGSS